jgi:hypothetical protein
MTHNDSIGTLRFAYAHVKQITELTKKLQESLEKGKGQANERLGNQQAASSVGQTFLWYLGHFSRFQMEIEESIIKNPEFNDMVATYRIS